MIRRQNGSMIHSFSCRVATMAVALPRGCSADRRKTKSVAHVIAIACRAKIFSSSGTLLAFFDVSRRQRLHLIPMRSLEHQLGPELKDFAQLA
jgi:hypothetical protein